MTQPTARLSCNSHRINRVFSASGTSASRPVSIRSIFASSAKYKCPALVAGREEHAKHTYVAAFWAAKGADSVSVPFQRQTKHIHGCASFPVKEGSINHRYTPFRRFDDGTGSIIARPVPRIKSHRLSRFRRNSSLVIPSAPARERIRSRIWAFVPSMRLTATNRPLTPEERFR